MARDITQELVRDALSFISPDCGHDDRARLAFAVWDGLGDAGADAWLSWAGHCSSATARELADTWKSCRKPGQIKIGTLFGMAKDRGFTWPDAGEVVAPDPAVVAAQAAKRERERLALEAQYRERADQAARVARWLWGDAEREGMSPYLQRKRVQGYGVRYLADGTLLVPMRNAAGELQNLQRIAPVKPAGDEPEKRYLPGGRKKGLLHLIGASAGVCTRGDEHVPVLLLAEGYATAASLHEATGRPVAVCFDAGNLKSAAAELRDVHPTALMVICADDDHGTEAAKGHNPGREGAEAAMRAVITPTGWAMVVMPQGLPEGGTDFNDLHVHAGLAAVRDQVEPMIEVALLGLRAALEPVAEPEPDSLSDFERDCQDAVPWDADVPLDELVRMADEGPDAGEASSPPPSPAVAARARKVGEGAPAARAPGGDGGDSSDPESAKLKKLRMQVDAISKRFSLIYSTDTAWDAREEMIVRVQAMRLTFGREPVNQWLARPSRRLVMPRDLVFEPGQKVAEHQINMFSGLDLDPVACTAEDVAPMLGLLRHLCSETGTSADDVDAVMHWILCWQALPLQKLGTKMQTAICFHGAQGTGKNLYWDAWRNLFGEHGITIGQVELEDKFNGWISRKLAIIADEVVSRQEMYHGKNKIKLIVTQHDKFPIRGMQMETRWESNHANVVFLSNEGQPLALEERDRRMMVVYTPLEAEAQVYEAVRDFMAAGGLARWMHYLQTYEIGDFTAHAKPLMTRAKAELIELNWRPPERFAYEWLDGYLELPVRVCSAEQLYRAFRRWCDIAGERWPPAQAIFTRSVDRWVKERVQRDSVTGRFDQPRLTYKQVALKDEAANRKTVRCWLPTGVGPMAGISEGEWAHESVQAFEDDLRKFCRRPASDLADAA